MYAATETQQLAAKIRQIEEENAALRNKLMKAADENFELQAIMATTEEEAKHRASVEVVGLKSEISFKNKEIEEHKREMARIARELAELRQRQSSNPQGDLRPVSSSNIPKVTAPPVQPPESSNVQFSGACGSPYPSSLSSGTSMSAIHKAVQGLLLSCSAIFSEDQLGLHLAPMFPSTATPITVQHSASHLKSAFRSTPRQTPQRLSGATHSRPSGIYDTSTNPLTFFLVQVSAFSDQVALRRSPNVMPVLDSLLPLWSMLTSMCLPFANSAGNVADALSMSMSMSIDALIRSLALFPILVDLLPMTVCEPHQRARRLDDMSEINDEDVERNHHRSIRSNLSERFGNASDTMSASTGHNGFTSSSAYLSRAFSRVTLSTLSARTTSASSSDSSSAKMTLTDALHQEHQHSRHGYDHGNGMRSSAFSVSHGDIGQFLEKAVEILQDIARRHVLLQELNECNYRFSSHVPILSMTLLQCVNAVGHLLHSRSRRSIVGSSRELSRYASDLFQCLAISRVQYHRPLWLPPHSSIDSISSEVFTTLSAGSLVSILYQYTSRTTSSSATNRNLYLTAMRELLSHEAAFTSFFHQQMRLIRQVQFLRLQAELEAEDGQSSSRGQSNRSKAQEVSDIVAKVGALLPYLCQELQSGECFLPETSRSTPSALSNGSKQNLVQRESLGSTVQSTHGQDTDRTTLGLSTANAAAEGNMSPSAAAVTSFSSSVGSSSTITGQIRQSSECFARRLHRARLQHNLQIVRLLYHLCRRWQDCVVLLLLQIVPASYPEAASDLKVHKNRGNRNLSTTAMDVDDDLHDLHHSIPRTLGASSSTSSSALNPHPTNKKAQQQPQKNKKRRANGRLRALDVIDEEDEEADADMEGNGNGRMNNSSRRHHANGDSSLHHQQACDDEFQWKSFRMTSLDLPRQQLQQTQQQMTMRANNDAISQQGVDKDGSTTATAITAATLAFDRSSLVSLCRLWMRLWRLCDELPLMNLYPDQQQRSGKHDSELRLGRASIDSYEDHRLVIQLTREVTQLVNCVIGLLGDPQQRKFLLRDCLPQLEAFMFRDLLGRLHPLLDLSDEDINHIDALG